MFCKVCNFLYIIFLTITISSCIGGENHHLNTIENYSTAIERDGPVSVAPPKSNNPNFGGYFYEGDCFPDEASVTFTSPDTKPKATSCLCTDGVYKCGPVSFSGKGPNAFAPQIIGRIIDPNENEDVIDFTIPIILPSVQITLPEGYNEEDLVRLFGSCKSDNSVISFSSPNPMTPPSPDCDCLMGKFDCGDIQFSGTDGDSSLSLNIAITDLAGNNVQQEKPDTLEIIPNVNLNIHPVDLNLGDQVFSFTGSCFPHQSLIKVTQSQMAPNERNCLCDSGNFSCDSGIFSQNLSETLNVLTEITSPSTQKNNINEKQLTLYKSRITSLKPQGYTAGENIQLIGTCSPVDSQISIQSESLTNNNLTCPCESSGFNCGETTVLSAMGVINSKVVTQSFTSAPYPQTYSQSMSFSILGPNFISDGSTFNVSGICNGEGATINILPTNGILPSAQDCLCENSQFSCGPFTDSEGISQGGQFDINGQMTLNSTTITTQHELSTVYIKLTEPDQIGYSTGDQFVTTGICIPNGTANITLTSPIFNGGTETCSCTNGDINCNGSELLKPAGTILGNILSTNSTSSSDSITTVEKPRVEITTAWLPNDNTHFISGTCGGNGDVVNITTQSDFSPVQASCPCINNEFSCGVFSDLAGWPQNLTPSFTAHISNSAASASDTKEFSFLAIDLDPPRVTGFEVGEVYQPTGKCHPDNSAVELSSDSIETDSISCSCLSKKLYCPDITLTATEKPILAKISNSSITSFDNEYIEAKPSFSCPILPTASGTFLEGESSTGSIALPIINSVNDSISVQINGNGFSGSFSGIISSDDNSIIVPVFYDGTGFGGGNRKFSITANGILGDCEGEAYVMNAFEQAFGIYSSIYVEDGTDGICGKQIDNDVYCWGTQSQFHGGPSNGNLVQIAMPGGVTPLQPLPLEANGFSITTSGELISWGQYKRTDKHYALGRPGVDGEYNPADFVTGWPANLKVKVLLGEHNEACTIMDNNDQYCWGRNQTGELGTGSFQTEITPVLVNQNVAKMMIGGSVHCVIKFDGKLYCAGQNNKGQIGDGTFTDRPSYVVVPGISDVHEIQFVGNQAIQSTCVLLNNGQVWCWGRNDRGQLGHGTIGGNIPSPTQVLGLNNVTKIRGGVNHMCALKEDKTLWCWGKNGVGQLGNGSTSDSGTATMVSGLTGVVDFGVGQDHSCALKDDNTAWCWGTGASKRLGNDNTDFKTTPVQFGSSTSQSYSNNVDAIKIFRYDSCILNGYNVYCAGKHSGTTLNSPKFIINN